MGTRGYYCLCWKGIYYVFYNHWDSYFEGLGEGIRKELAKMSPEDFQLLKQNLEKITRLDIFNCGKRKGFESLMAAAEKPQEYELVYITERCPSLEYDREYLYIVDLDDNLFICETVHYRGSIQWKIDKIPENWYPTDDS